jgi:hypothetical protein
MIADPEQSMGHYSGSQRHFSVNQCPVPSLSSKGTDSLPKVDSETGTDRIRRINQFAVVGPTAVRDSSAGLSICGITTLVILMITSAMLLVLAVCPAHEIPVVFQC